MGGGGGTSCVQCMVYKMLGCAKSIIQPLAKMLHICLAWFEMAVYQNVICRF